MGKTTPLSRSHPPGGGLQRVEPGGQLLKELEALSVALYNAGQTQTATITTTPLKKLAQGSVPSHLSKPPSPYLGAQRSDAEQPPPPSPYLNHSNSYGGGAKHVQVIGGSYKRSGPPSPYLGTLNGNGGNIPTGMAESPNSNLGRMGSRREGGSRPPLVQPTLLNLDIEQQPSKSSSSVHYVGGRREVIPSSAAGLGFRQVANSSQSQGCEAAETLSPLMSGLWSLEIGEEKDEIQPRPLSIIEEVVPEIDGGKNQSKWFHIVKSKPRNPFQSPKLASLNPLQSPKVTSRNPFQSPKLASLNPLQSPKLASLNPLQSPKLASLNPFQSPNLASLNPLQSPKVTSLNNLQSPKVASRNPFHSPKLASLNPLQSPKLASLNPFQSPKVTSQNPLQSQKLASPNPFHSPKLTSLNPFHSPGIIPLKDSGKRKFETYKLDRRGRVGPEVVDPALQAWHSQEFEKQNYNNINNSIDNVINNSSSNSNSGSNNNRSNRKRGSKEVGNINFPAWLKDNDHLTKSLEVPNNEKKSLWSWKPFRAIAHIRQQRFNCMFTVRVHEIKDLPAVLNGVRLVVQFKRRDSVLQTMPSRVFHGLAEVEEMLNIKSTVYATKSGNNGMMKYTPKTFNLAVVAPDIDELVLGMHRLDLSRLLPESTEVSFDDEGSKTWTTRFKLVGKAKGGILVVTFGYQLLNKDSQPTKTLSSARFDSPLLRPLRFYNSLPNSPQEFNNSSSDVQFSPAFPEFPSYMRMEHLNLDDNPNDHRFVNSKSGHESFQRQQPESNGLNQEVHNKHVTTLQAAPKASNEKLLNQASRIAAGSAEFTVMHVSATLNHSSLNINSDDPLAEEDTIEGMLEADAVNLVEDPELARTQVGTDVWDVMQLKGKEEILSDDKFVTTDIEAIEVTRLTDELTLKLESLESIIDSKIPDALASDNNNVTDVTDKVKEEAEEHRNVKCMNVNFNGENVQKLSTSTSPIDYSVDLPTIECMQNLHIHEEEEGVPLLGDLNYEEDEKIKVVFEDEGFLHCGMGGMNFDDMDKETQRHGHGHANSNDFEAVTGEFLSFLRDDNESVVASSSESSPRARLLREFEKETLFTDGGLGGWDFLLSEDSKFPDETIACDELKLEEAGKSDMIDSSRSVSGCESEEEFELASFVEVAEAEFQRATDEHCGKLETARNNVTSLKSCEHMGPETHVEEKWSPNNGVFDAHKPVVAIMPAPSPPHYSTSSETIKKAPGQVLLIRDGGSLRSVSPLQFQVGESSISGHLMMQVSRPVVVPSEERATSLDILRQLAMAGMEGMATKAIMAMPLEDIAGKAFDQIAMEAKVPVHRNRLGGVATINGAQEGTSLSRVTDLYHSDGNMLDDYLLLHDLAPMALEKIESLALEGLRVQTGEVEDERQMEYAAFSKASEVDLMSRAISLDEWLQFNSCAVDSVNNENCHNHFPLLATGTTSIYNTDLVVYEKQQMSRDEKLLSTFSVDATRGFTTGDTVTLTMLVQLRDPLQNNKAVGAPMMAIIQAERVMVPATQNLSLHFKIVDITVSGLNSSCSMQSVGKAHLSPKPRLNSGARNESLWSFSAYCCRRSNAASDCWQDILEVNRHVRNPDIVFPNSTSCTK